MIEMEFGGGLQEKRQGLQHKQHKQLDGCESGVHYKSHQAT